MDSQFEKNLNIFNTTIFYNFNNFLNFKILRIRQFFQFEKLANFSVRKLCN